MKLKIIGQYDVNHIMTFTDKYNNFEFAAILVIMSVSTFKIVNILYVLFLSSDGFIYNIRQYLIGVPLLDVLLYDGQFPRSSDQSLTIF
jgi:hypothetical protein